MIDRSALKTIVPSINRPVYSPPLESLLFQSSVYLFARNVATRRDTVLHQHRTSCLAFQLLPDATHAVSVDCGPSSTVVFSDLRKRQVLWTFPLENKAQRLADVKIDACPFSENLFLLLQTQDGVSEVLNLSGIFSRPLVQFRSPQSKSQVLDLRILETDEGATHVAFCYARSIQKLGFQRKRNLSSVWRVFFDDEAAAVQTNFGLKLILVEFSKGKFLVMSFDGVVLKVFEEFVGRPVRVFLRLDSILIFDQKHFYIQELGKFGATKEILLGGVSGLDVLHCDPREPVCVMAGRRCLQVFNYRSRQKIFETNDCGQGPKSLAFSGNRVLYLSEACTFFEVEKSYPFE